MRELGLGNWDCYVERFAFEYRVDRHRLLRIALRNANPDAFGF